MIHILKNNLLYIIDISIDYCLLIIYALNYKLLSIHEQVHRIKKESPYYNKIIFKTL